MKEKIKIATIGTSRITNLFINGAEISKKFSIGAIYSRNQHTAEEFSSAHGNVPYFTDLQQLATSPDIEAVYIASPNALHYPQAKLMLEHGKHVLCEKSICAHPEQLAELQALAKEKHLILMEAMMFVHFPSLKILTEALNSIGEIHKVHIVFCQRSHRYEEFASGLTPNIFNPHFEAGALMDLGVYCVYPALHFFGIPHKITATALLDRQIDVQDAVIFDYPNLQVLISCSKSVHSYAPSEFIGSKGSITIDSISQLSNIQRIHKEHREVLWPGEPREGQLQHEANFFADCIRTPNEHQHYYEYCSKLSLDVCRTLREIRKKAGIVFPSDAEYQ